MQFNQTKIRPWFDNNNGPMDSKCIESHNYEKTKKNHLTNEPLKHVIPTVYIHSS